jgi:hypothetical protein
MRCETNSPVSRRRFLLTHSSDRAARIAPRTPRRYRRIRRVRSGSGPAMLPGRVGGKTGGAAQPPDQDVADGVRGAQFAPGGCLGEQTGGLLAGCFGVGEGGGQRVPAGFGQDLLRQVRQRAARCPVLRTAPASRGRPRMPGRCGPCLRSAATRGDASCGLRTGGHRKPAGPGEGSARGLTRGSAGSGSGNASLTRRVSSCGLGFVAATSALLRSAWQVRRLA